MSLQEFVALLGSAGDRIIDEGAEGDALHVLVEGEVHVSQKVDGGDGELVDALVQTMTRGVIFGERSLTRGEPTSATVTAVTACVTLRLGKGLFDALPASVLACLRDTKYMSDHRDDQTVSAHTLRPVAVIGRGQYGPVQLCKCEATAAAYVVKTLSRAAVAKERQQVSVMAEVMLLREIQHPLIVSLHGSHKTANSLCLIFEPILGGETV